MNILPKGSKLYSIFKYKCPRCHQGDVFKSKSSYNLPKMFDMHEQCSNCELRYEFEPGFFYGAMYVSYGLTVALGVATYVLMQMFFEASVAQIILVLIAVLIVGSPLVLRLSRIIWMNLFIKYEPEKRGVNK
ncbi:hypothetical protein Oweho_2791 [Owenweeksia hongkongensis DSM 17368]|uniref:DUF983 domain-containing protein n=1 Tax=Owenweeksia hongkongensis (strain DSM 17368 / CIP 108786 / JCM 12287 / NRRL B-23963 / UST20020801) TaxID=926562 RepID=G8R085_OWEHD|nr:DUF983 domain-containing protein [Owenweeksia hongkongensis]AEV33751.1 hypothetical protein Oweho_2791 [Owenweeksia hongkongensis DSM 17368]